ncbi:Uncharacterised protein [Faecalibacterium prausnitzii]|nr:Uncharacterised protein [Faecalibacterium prausnitzii]
MKEQPDNQLSPQELLERDQKLLEALCIDYTAVYYCNLAKNTMEPIKRSVHYTTFSGGTTVERFKRYLETDLLPHLNGNSILVMDNMKSHHAKAVKELLDSSGVRYIYLPPYSPDLNPFEKLWSKVKALLHKFKARTLDALPNAIQNAFHSVTVSDCSGWFRFCGYAL